jgi:hypothetical protein
MNKYFLYTQPSNCELNWDDRNPSSYLSKDDAFKELQKAIKRAEKKNTVAKQERRSFSVKKK